MENENFFQKKYNLKSICTYIFSGFLILKKKRKEKRKVSSENQKKIWKKRFCSFSDFIVIFHYSNRQNLSKSSNRIIILIYFYKGTSLVARFCYLFHCGAPNKNLEASFFDEGGPFTAIAEGVHISLSFYFPFSSIQILSS